MQYTFGNSVAYNVLNHNLDKILQNHEENSSIAMTRSLRAPRHGRESRAHHIYTFTLRKYIIDEVRVERIFGTHHARTPYHNGFRYFSPKILLKMFKIKVLQLVTNNWNGILSAVEFRKN